MFDVVTSYAEVDEMMLAYEANAWGGVVGTPGAVTDIGSGFYLTPGDLRLSLDAIARAGFTGVELFDGNLLAYGDDLAAFRRELDDRGLALTGVYSGGHFIYADAHADEFARFSRSIALAAEAGAQHYVLGGGAVRHDGRRSDDFRVMAELLDRVVDAATDAGMTVSYHPHLGSLAESPDEIDALLSASKVGLCADVAHIAAAGGDPADIIRRYAERLHYVHLKDLDRASGSFVPLGAGDLDLDAVVDAVIDAGYDGWFVVEVDGYAGDLDEAAATSFQFLRNGRLAG
ncbi:MAG: sugar phosphate isomerase [Leifsonia xyli]|nr:MAG: sugar phosphate isomerase [Leifsonia xyli]